MAYLNGLYEARMHVARLNLPPTHTLIDPQWIEQVVGTLPPTVPNLTDDSREVTASCLFIARTCHQPTRDLYITQAIKQGARVVLCEMSNTQPDWLSLARKREVATVFTNCPVNQRMAGHIAETFFDYPASKLKLIGITGTNGKTTTAYLTQHLLKACNLRTGLIGTVVVDVGDKTGPTPATLTTPGAIDFSRLLAQMVANGCKAAVAEVSSHALHQGRADALRFDAAIFTNLTGDHLDYHGSMDAYAQAKSLLFANLADNAHAILNADDTHSQTMASATHATIRWTTLHPEKNIAAKTGEVICAADIHTLTAHGSCATLAGPWGSVQAQTALVGRHNVCNLLQAITAATCIHPMNGSTLTQALAQLPGVPGRLEPISPDWPKPAHERIADLPAVLVDYAHTDDALQNVLEALRPVVEGKLIVMFGCGGDRDRTKRPRMAKVACEWADVVCITSDNPRTEDPQAIVDDVYAGVAEQAKTKVCVEMNRAKAIAYCIATAQPTDTVLLAGKGHEDYQILGKTRIHFDDREQAAMALQKRSCIDHRS